MLLGTLALYAGANFYIFVRLTQARGLVPLWLRVVFGVLYWLAACGMFVSFGLRNIALPEFLHRVLHVVGTSWLLFTLYMAVALVVADLAHWVWPSFHHGVWYALGITLAVLVAGYINYRNPRVEHMTIETDKPIEGGRMRLVAISDVHLGRGTTRSDLERYVSIINSENPDVLLIVGDLIDNSILPVEKADMCREFERVEARYGIYMSAGNHEYISGIGKVEKFLEKTPITLLRDSVVVLPGGAVLAGRDDRSNRHRKSVEDLLCAVDTLLPDSHSAHVILLEHQPYDIATKSTMGFDLQIYGHTHRGQVWPMSLLVDRMYEQSHGYRQWGTSHVIVTEGLSLWGPPFRIGTCSNLFIVTLSSCTNT